jgi:hypothetical protein
MHELKKKKKLFGAKNQHKDIQQEVLLPAIFLSISHTLY